MAKKKSSVLKNPPGIVPHVIDWNKVQTDMKALIDQHEKFYRGIVDGTIPLEGDDDGYYLD